MPNNTHIINIYKPVGLSPLDAIKLFKLKNSAYKDTKMTYAGRLDPMAEGVLLVLGGKGIFEKDKYLKLDKEYDAEIIFGFSTDTHDILGIPKKWKNNIPSAEKATAEIKKFIGDFVFSLPAYSSYKIKGKPLFQWAREGNLNKAKKVERTTRIYNITLKGSDRWQKINADKLFRTIIKKINLVQGDFRQDKIKEEWKKVLEKSGGEYAVVEIKVKCSSGTYIRSLANELGKKLKIGATLLSLKRTKVGEFLIKNSVKVV